jgi:ferredoxin-type protein NapG
MTEKKSKKAISRRKFIKGSTVAAVGIATAYGAVSVPLLKRDRLLLRPPGALDEDTFLASCIKCGQCLQVCPPQVIDLANISQGFGVGTPHITPREGGCILCAGLPCVLACPTGALDHQLSVGKDAEMGLAVIIHPKTCLSISGANDLAYRLQNLLDKKNRSTATVELTDILRRLLTRLTSDELKALNKRFQLEKPESEKIPEVASQLDREDQQWLLQFVQSAKQADQACRICLDDCPIKVENTIIFERKTDGVTGKAVFWPRVQESCVGCGVCEEKCPTMISSIIIKPRLKWTGLKS